MKDLKASTKVKSKSKDCFFVNGDGKLLPNYLDFNIQVLNKDGSVKFYNISRSPEGGIGRIHMIITYVKLPDVTFYYRNEVNKRCKLYTNEEFDKKLDKLAKELSKQNIIKTLLKERDFPNI